MSRYRQMRPASRLAEPLLAALAVTAIGLSAGCGGGDGNTSATGARGSAGDAGDSGVASIVGSAGPDASPSPQAERPLIRPDTSAEEQERLMNLWLQCFEDNGVSEMERKTRADTPQVRQVAEDCAPLEPERLWQRSLRLDPEYPDKLLAWAECLQDRGVDAFVDGDFLSLADGLPAGTEVEDCEAEAFSGS
ncbi:hypothetical protein O7543_17465 [Solwaraspora sp. WMMA2080]|uniref:hypothetical protein n=1 Tax=Solwaraspora sp. WMMA2080 TaxID=3015165 RepID=UPI00248C7D51|nr:hypothetical protein [Solwaraspora sp. WMMA2080]WBC18711.1 hypothetical protein O7543_17465 [Solwaraspora sp. WMMA2080]